MSARYHVWLAWGLLIISIVGMPVSALTWASDEPVTVLILSWVALAYAAFTAIESAETRKQNEERNRG